MSGINSVSSITPTQNQILEYVLHHELSHQHGPHFAAPAADDPHSAAAAGIGLAAPTTSQIEQAILDGQLPELQAPNATTPAASQANPSSAIAAAPGGTSAINETA